MSSQEAVRPIVYVAARFPHKERAAALARGLTSEGAVVNSRWLQEPCTSDSDPIVTVQYRAERAREDLQDLTMSDAVVLFNPIESTGVGTGGCHVEVGYALALWKPVVIVGALSNVFHYLDQCALAAGPATAMQCVRTLLEQQQTRLLSQRKARKREKAESRRLRDAQA